MKKITIITINKNNAAGLEKTIQSIVEQQSNDFEYIVIDGDSSDESIRIIKKYESKIFFWQSEPDDGVYDAMNKGINKASGDYCLFINSGDTLFSKTVIEEFIILNNSSDIISGNAIVNTGLQSFELVKSPLNLSFYVFYKHTLLHQATFIKRILFEKYGLYNSKLKLVADWEFFVKVICLSNCTYQSIPLTVSVFDSNGISSQIQNKEICSKERLDVLRQNFSAYIPDYQLIEDRSVFEFLTILNKKPNLKKCFILFTKIFNKFFKLKLKKN